MSLKTFISSFLLIWLLSSCSRDRTEMTRVSVHVYAAPTEKIYLSRLPNMDEKIQVMDSAVIKEEQDSILFSVPKDDEHLYELNIKSSHQRFSFIADANYILIRANNITGRFTAEGSPATSSLKKFYEERTTVFNRALKVTKKMDSINKSQPLNKELADSISAAYKEMLNSAQQMMRNYTDTVSNATAFLAGYNNVDFGDDRGKLKEMMLRAQQRFPHSKAVNNLAGEVYDMISIYEQEFNVGDTLPPIELPDAEGGMVSTKSFAGKYYLLDFWATWCPRCLLYNPYKVELSSRIDPASCALVSVALDDNTGDWKAMISQNRNNWIQLIDHKMWRGTAAKTLKFDSIPFNFLVSPKGIVLAKAIKADSLLVTVRKFVR